MEVQGICDCLLDIFDGKVQCFMPPEKNRLNSVCCENKAVLLDLLVPRWPNLTKVVQRNIKVYKKKCFHRDCRYFQKILFIGLVINTLYNTFEIGQIER